MKGETSLYEMQLEDTHLNIIISSLSCYMQQQYRGIELEVVDVNEATEKIKVASDMQLVIKHLLGIGCFSKTRHTPKQTAQNTGLIWLREIEVLEPFDVFDDQQSEQSQPISELLKSSWNNVKDRHWDTIKKMSDK